MTEQSRKLNDYYADLLPLQYQGRPKARAHIKATVSPIIMHQTGWQEILFSATPTSGNFWVMSDSGGSTSVGINWNATEAAVQTALRLLPGFADVQSTGTPAAGRISIRLYGVDPLPEMIFVSENYLVNGATPIEITVNEIDEPLPLAVENGFDVRPGALNTVGKQLDIVGKYVGASRVGRGFSTFVNLTDDEYTLLIRAAIGRNYAGTSLEDIDNFLLTYFPGQIFVYDYGNMHLGYFIAPGTLSSNLLQTFIGQGLLPKPMGVKIAPIIYSLTDELLFGFNSYAKVNPFASGFNSYADYSLDVTWLTYAYVITV